MFTLPWSKPKPQPPSNENWISRAFNPDKTPIIHSGTFKNQEQPEPQKPSSLPRDSSTLQVKQKVQIPNIQNLIGQIKLIETQVKNLTKAPKTTKTNQQAQNLADKISQLQELIKAQKQQRTNERASMLKKQQMNQVKKLIHKMLEERGFVPLPPPKPLPPTKPTLTTLDSSISGSIPSQPMRKPLTPDLRSSIVTGKTLRVTPK